MFEKIKHHVTTKLFFTPRYFADATEKNKDSYYGSRFQLKNDPSLLDTFIQQTNKKFNIKIKKVDDSSGVDIRNLDSFKHTDDIAGKINLLIMINGPNEWHCFLHHIGFKKISHSSHASNIPNLIHTNFVYKRI
jgi:hypothetical protein